MSDRPSPDRLAAVERVTDAALAHLELDLLLPELLERVCEILAVDTVAVLLLDEESNELIARAAVGLEGQVERGTRIPVGGGFAGRVAADRRPVIVDDVDHADILNPLLRERGVRSLLGVPLLVDGRVIGVMHVGSLSPRRFGSEEATLLQLVADRAALAIDHARLFQEERRARRAAEASARRLADLQAVTDVALAHLALDELLAVLLDRIKAILAVDTVAVLLLDEASNELVARAAVGLEGQVERGTRIPVGRGFAGRVAAERRTVVIDDVEHADILNPLLRERGVRSLVGAPLVGSGGVIGVVHAGSLSPRGFGPDEEALLRLVADRAAVAIERAQLYEREHRIAETLQRSLLPAQLVDLPGIDVAARYRAPEAADDVGGDWYDAIALPDGQVLVAIGDVVGRGLSAATLMGLLRNALRAYALEGLDPVDMAELLSRLARDAEPGATATMLCLVYAPDTSTAVMVNAGHPPAVVVAPSGEARFAESRASVPLGATRNAGFRAQTLELGPGSTVVLYTDGLVERRGEDLDVGLERLRAAVERAPTPASERCDAIIDALVDGRAAGDDVALVAFRPLPLPERLAESFDATPEMVPVMRRLLARWLVDRRVPDELAYDAVVACSEACANAVEHAYGPAGRQTFEVAGAVRDGELELSIRDYGGWREPRGEHRGRGLMLIEAFMDTVDLERRADGTTVVMRRRFDAGVPA